MSIEKAFPSPDLDLAALTAHVGQAALASSVWHHYACKLITPMYGGGVKGGEVDRSMPIRATAIRGQLRFWWRLLNRGRFRCGDKLNHRALFEAERAIWGGLGDKRTLATSKVIVRVVAPKVPVGQLESSTDRTSDRDIAYAFGAAANNGVSSWLKAGYEWSLHIFAPLELWPTVEETLRWWSCFGGVGARVRRGFGAVQVSQHEIDGDTRPMSPIGKDEARAHGMRLIIREDASQDPTIAWKSAAAALREFRQGEGHGRKTRREGDTDGRSPGRSHWPEPDAIRTIVGKWFGKSEPACHMVKNKKTGQSEPVGNPHDHAPRHPAGTVFPRAAFGLPIIFHFKDKGEPSPDIQLIPDNGSDRLASPLILRPYRDDAGKWRPSALCLPVGHVWKMGVRFKDRTETFSAGTWWPAKDHRKALADHIPPIAATGLDDPLSAFLKFFKQQGDR